MTHDDVHEEVPRLPDLPADPRAEQAARNEALATFEKLAAEPEAATSKPGPSSAASLPKAARPKKAADEEGSVRADKAPAEIEPEGDLSKLDEVLIITAPYDDAEAAQKLLQEIHGDRKKP